MSKISKISKTSKTRQISQFNELTNSINNSLSKNIRKQEGIYFTPKNIRERVCEVLEELEINPTSILEPSFGSAEFMDDMHAMYSDADLYGVEKNEEIFDQVVEEMNYEANLYCIDFLEYESGHKFDLIIGNPPYFVYSSKSGTPYINNMRQKCMSGRGNIFVLFIYKCIYEHLVDNGILAFVLPTSFYNCSYYQKCREYIAECCTILLVENLSSSAFYDTNQDTMLFVVKKKRSRNHEYLFMNESFVYITPYYKELRALIAENSEYYVYTLKELGYKVKTGTIVWNQYKDKLSDTPPTVLLYSSNIQKNSIQLHDTMNGGKKQYINNIQKEVEKGPSLLITRGYGNSYRFQYALVDMDEYYVENHINMIYYPLSSIATQADLPTIDFHTIISSLESERSREFIKYFVGNGALSKTELETVFPIFVPRHTM